MNTLNTMLGTSTVSFLFIHKTTQISHIMTPIQQVRKMRQKEYMSGPPGKLSFELRQCGSRGNALKPSLAMEASALLVSGTFATDLSARGKDAPGQSVGLQNHLGHFMLHQARQGPTGFLRCSFPPESLKSTLHTEES